MRVTIFSTSGKFRPVSIALTLAARSYALLFLYTAVKCGNLDSPTNGRVDLMGTAVGSTATYSCFPGFVLANGDRIRECGSDEKWSGTAPACVHWNFNAI